MASLDEKFGQCDARQRRGIAVLSMSPAEYEGVTRRFAATVAMDVAGFSKFMEEDETGTLQRFRSLRRVVADPIVQEHGGAVTGTAGDCLIATFDHVESAVECAVRVQEMLADWEPDVKSSDRMQLRIGVNAGDVLFANEEPYGDGVNIAARVQGLAQPGGVLLTDEAHPRLGADQASRFRAAGPQRLKNIARRVSVWHWHPNGEACALLSEPAMAIGPSIAVLPFANLSDSARWSRLCDGLAADITTDLARHADLAVIAHASSFAYRERLLDPGEIGHALNVRYVLTGSVQAESTQVLATAQLIDVASGVQVWAERHRLWEAEFLTLQEAVVSRVVAAVTGFDGALLRTELMRAYRKPAASLEAFDFYLLAYQQEVLHNAAGIQRSIELAEAAVRADPKFSRAWLVLSWALGNGLQNGWIEDTAPAEARRIVAVETAAALDPGDGLAIVALGRLRLRQNRDSAARESFERALILGRNHADTLLQLSVPVAGLLDRWGEALELVERARMLNPHAPAWYCLSEMRVAYFARRFELALDAAVRAPPWAATKLYMLLALAQLGRVDEARILAQDVFAAASTQKLIRAEKSFLCDAARSVFEDGLEKARQSCGTKDIGLPQAAIATA